MYMYVNFEEKVKNRKYIFFLMLPRGRKREGTGNKAKIDPEFAAVEEAAVQSFFCSVCGTGHDFKTRSNLNQHEKTDSHKRKIDPEFAAESFFCSVCGTGHDFKTRSHIYMKKQRRIKEKLIQNLQQSKKPRVSHSFAVFVALVMNSKRVNF